MLTLDFSYLIIAYPRESPDALDATVRFFVERGIRKFLFVLDFDRNHASVAMMLDRIKRFAAMLQPIRPRGIEFHIAANLFLSNGILYDPQLYRICVGHSNILCTQLPSDADADWIHHDLNHLLFHQKISPLFISFDRTLIMNHTNDPTVIQRYTKSQFFRFAIDIYYLTAVDAEPFVRQIVERKIPIVPCVIYDWKRYNSIPKYFHLMQQRLGDDLYFQLCRLMQQTGHHIFSKF